jgi:hypothetical protein
MASLYSFLTGENAANCRTRYNSIELFVFSGYLTRNGGIRGSPIRRLSGENAPASSCHGKLTWRGNSQTQTFVAFESSHFSGDFGGHLPFFKSYALTPHRMLSALITAIIFTAMPEED